MQTKTPRVLHVTDTRIASCLLALGFPGGVFATLIASARDTQVEVQFEGASTRFPELDPHNLVSHWNTGTLEQEEPMHMLCCMMRAQRSYDAFLKLQREGGGIRLEPNDRLKPLHYRYQPGPCGIDPFIGSDPLGDLSLVAALGPLGIGLVRLLGSHGQHAYVVASMGRPVLLSDGTFHRHVLADLIRRAPDGQSYALEAEQPHHPLISGLEALHARACLKREIQSAQANTSLLVTAGDGTSKQALLSLNPRGHVVRTVERHLGAAPGSLDI